MSETENNTIKVNENELFNKLSSGDYGLAKTYWIFGVLVGIAVNVIVTAALAFNSMSIVYFVLLLHSFYFYPLAFGTWRAADKYSRKKVWATLAKIAVILAIFGMIFNWIGFFMLLGI